MAPARVRNQMRILEDNQFLDMSLFCYLKTADRRSRPRLSCQVAKAVRVKFAA